MNLPNIFFTVDPADAEAARIPGLFPPKKAWYLLPSHVIIQFLTIENIHDIIQSYLETMSIENSNIEIRFIEHSVSWIITQGPLSINLNIYENTGSTGYIVEVHNMASGGNPKLSEFLFAILKWHFDSIETRGPMPLITDFITTFEQMEINRSEL